MVGQRSSAVAVVSAASPVAASHLASAASAHSRLVTSALKTSKNTRNTLTARISQHQHQVRCSSSPEMTSLTRQVPGVATEANGDARHFQQLLTPTAVEAWLDSHPRFLADYLARHNSKTQPTADVSSVSTSYSRQPVFFIPSTEHGERLGSLSNLSSLVTSSGEASDATTVGVPRISFDYSHALGSSSSLSESGNTSPARKISAQEFERGAHLLHPMVSTVDGQVTFLATPSTSLPSNSRSCEELRRKRGHLKTHDERELLYELVMDICNDLDVTSLCHKILQNVSILLNADRCSLFLVEERDRRKSLVSKLFDVNDSSTIEMSQRNDEIRVPLGCGIVGHVAETGQPLNIADAYEVRNARTSPPPLPSPTPTPHTPFPLPKSLRTHSLRFLFSIF